MNVNEVKDMKWISAFDWSELSESPFPVLYSSVIQKEDVDYFVEHLFKEVARRLDISYLELLPILKEKNSAFYSNKTGLFYRYSALSPTHSGLVELKKLLLIPDVTAVQENVTNVDKILNNFSALTEIEKFEVLQRLGTISVKVEFIPE